MSTQSKTTNPALIPITVPSINETGYASALNDAFKNIDANFTTLANYDFIKGESGTSVNIKETPFYITDQITGKKKLSYYGKMLQDYIISLASNADEQSDVKLSDGTTLNIFDNFTADNAGSIYMIFSTENDFATATTPMSSLYYVFLDGRYASPKSNLANENQYVNIKDFSCIVVYDGSIKDADGYVVGGFKSLSNAFPTIYFEKGVGLCWKINGSETGLPVQGLPGRDGSNATLYIVQANSITGSECEISGIYEPYDGYVPINDYGDVSHLDNQAALILTNDANSDKNLFYFGKLGLEDKEIIDGEETKIVKTLIGYCSPSTSINSAIDNEAFINSLKSINILNNGVNGDSGIKGLFIPLENNTANTQKVHLLSATSIANVENKANDLKTDVLFTPIKDINTLQVIGDKTNNQLQIEKYLYVKLNEERLATCMTKNDIALGSGVARGYLKYKLEGIVTDANSDFLGSNTSASGSRYYGYIIDSSASGKPTVKLTKDNTRYVDANGDIVKEHYKSMPASFSSRLSVNNTAAAGIYRWVLCTTKNSWDTDELLTQSGSTYSFDNKFKTIFTTTVSPGVGADFMWFNALELDEDYKYERYEETINGAKTQFYIVPGWSGSNDFFEFIKFVPIYLNDFKIAEDSALNLNYNVNITGDKDNPNKSITVHGDVNCDNLSVYRLTATGTIKNIYTEDDIIGSKGIYLGKEKYSSNDASCSIDVNGNIIANEAKFNGQIQTDSAIISRLDNSVINTNDINIDVSNDTFVHVNKLNNAVEAELAGVDSIKITPINKSVSTVADVPAITSSMPAHCTNNANIVVSNQASDSPEIYIKDTPRKNGTYDAGGGVDTESTSFESAKNFNMHRLSLNSTSSTGNAVAKKSANDSNTSLGTNSASKFVISTSNSTPTSSSISAASSKPTQSTMSDLYIQKMTFSSGNDATYNKLNTSSNLVISFTNDFLCHVGLEGECSYGGWPALNSSSYMQLKVYYSTDNGTTIIDTGVVSDKYFFDYSTTSTADDNGKEWKGYSATGKDLKDDFDNQWRYYAFKFKPSSITIPTSNGEYSKIVSAFNNSKIITIYVVPYFNIKAHVCKNRNDKQKEILKNIRVTCPRVYGSNTGAATTKLIKQSSCPAITFAVTNYNSGVGYLTYYVNSVVSKSSDVSATTICDDGVVIRAGSYVFGLGYAESVVNHKTVGYNHETNDNSWKVTGNVNTNFKKNVPVLFYHKYDDSYYLNKEPKLNEGKTKQGYAKRVDAIPLEDIFACIKYLRTDKGFSFGI